MKFIVLVVLYLAFSFAFAQQPTCATCWLQPTIFSEVRGKITIRQFNISHVFIEADVYGLEPETSHGFHIHEYGDISDPKGLKTGDHYNPFGEPHGCPGESERYHVGDLGSITAGKDGRASFLHYSSLIRLDGKRSVIGRSFIVHRNKDDCVSQPSGKSGDRFAQCVIGYCVGEK